jgi:hypothetical protein
MDLTQGSECIVLVGVRWSMRNVFLGVNAGFGAVGWDRGYGICAV